MFSWVLGKLDFGQILTTMVDYIPNLIAALVLAVVFFAAFKLLKRFTAAALRRSALPEGIQGLITRALKYSILALAVLTIANNLGFNIASLLAGVGIAGLAVSLAAQDTVTNVISGFTIVVDRPFRKGDWIRLGDLHAQVSEIRLRTTLLTTFDNESLVVPNRQLISERIVNYTLTKRIRVRVPVGIAYKESTAAARQVMLATTVGDPRIMREPEPSVIVTGLGDSSVNLELRFWVDEPTDLLPMLWEYTEKCKSALDAADIEIPFPHMQLFLEKSDGLTQLVGARAGR